MSMYFPNPNEYPNYRTVYIEVVSEDGNTYSGSGVMVGRNDILTASHVVYQPGFKTVDINIYPGYPGDQNGQLGPPEPWGSFDGQNISGLTPEQVAALTSGVWQVKGWPIEITDEGIEPEQASWDLALIGISDPIGDETGWYNINSYQ